MDPTNLADAKKCEDWPDWEKAINTELETLNHMNVWETVDLPQDCKAIPNCWVFTYKFDENGNVTNYKVQLIVKGFMQHYGMDFTPCSHQSSNLTDYNILHRLNLKNCNQHQHPWTVRDDFQN
jgi:Reverse transcriptase (RNA-dependent DNA polymerase)